MKRFLLSLCLCFVFIGIVMAQSNDAFPVQTTLSVGLIEGNYSTRSGIQSYLGIPYAQPPVGDLRWKAPQPMQPWEGVKSTKQFGPRAMQEFMWDDMVFRSDGVNEDCLYLNVWTPAKRNTTGLPVLVYFYGGGFVAGDGSEYRYDGASMAQQGIVAVTVNYRLNIFGFFAHPDLSAEASYQGSGNYGLLDQHLALKWVQENIAAFGGDPGKVTIAGESAGSVSVSYQMASPLSKDLIAGAIGESGAGISPTLAPIPLAEAEQIGQDFATKAGYPTLAELRQLPARDIYELYNESGRFGFPVTIDGHFLPKTLPEIFEAGEQAQVPLLVGWNSAEIPGGSMMRGKPYSPENFVKAVQAQYPEHQAQLLALYPHETAEEVERSATDLASDGFIVFSTWKWLDLHRKHSDQPVYRYLFSKLPPPMKAAGPYAYVPIGAPHAREIEYCLGNLPLVDLYEWAPEDHQVSQTMQGYFANFIKTGNPNGPDLTEWPAVDPASETPAVMILDVESRVESARHEARYEVLEEVYGKE